ncbi:MAG TPA: CBS domain-containing protein [Gemmatimonadales bacterium]|jgi:CBS domain-containing protein
MKAQDLMTTEPACCAPSSTVREAAQLMREHDCGCIPVVEGKSKRLVGMVTDRDVACRCVAEGKSPDTPVREIMTTNPQSSHPEDDIAAVEQIMIEAKVRRVPVVDDGGRCIGMIAQADLALNHEAATDRDVGHVVERISEPGSSKTT